MNTFERDHTRTQKYKILKKFDDLRASTKSLIRIPCNNKTYGFQMNTYPKYKQVLHDKISEEEFKGFIRKANRIVDQEIYNKNEKEKLPFFPFLSKALKVSLALCLLGCLILSIIVYADFEKQIERIILIICVLLICISTLIGAISPIIMLQSQYEEIEVDSVIKEKLNELASTENDKNNSGKEYLLWKFEVDFFWIELHLNWQKWNKMHDRQQQQK